MNEIYFCEYLGGFFNERAAQLERSNSFIIQQGRVAEALLMEITWSIISFFFTQILSGGYSLEMILSAKGFSFIFIQYSFSFWIRYASSFRFL